MSANKCVRSVTPLTPNDFRCDSNVSQCHDCPFAVCNPLRYRTMEQKLRNAIAYLDGWANGTYIVAVDTNDFDVINHRYDLRAVIAGLNVILHEALSLPLGDLPRWEDQYPVHVPVDTTQVKRQKGRD